MYACRSSSGLRRQVVVKTFVVQVDPINDIVYHICIIPMESNAVLESYPRGHGRQNETTSITAEAYWVGGCCSPFYDVAITMYENQQQTVGSIYEKM